MDNNNITDNVFILRKAGEEKQVHYIATNKDNYQLLLCLAKQLGLSYIADFGDYGVIASNSPDAFISSVELEVSRYNTNSLIENADEIFTIKDKMPSFLE